MSDAVPTIIMQKFLISLFNLRSIPDGAEPEIISTIKKTFNFGQSEAVHLFQTLLECMKKRELVSKSLRAARFCLMTILLWEEFKYILLNPDNLSTCKYY